MEFTEILGWSGNLGFFLGAIFIAKKDIRVFFYQIVGNSFYAVQSYILGVNSLFILSIILIIVNVFGWINWIRIKRKESK